MPRRPDMPCADCGRLMWRGPGVLGPGISRCRACRQAVPIRASGKHPCVDCGAPAIGIRCRACRDADQRSGQTTAEILENRRTLERRRREREKRAPGLTTTQRKHLRDQWRRQRRVCAYCQKAPATQVDHVIPLALGGTNHIGNLAPSCGPCNRAKGANLLIEWRAGKKARRMRWVASAA